MHSKLIVKLMGGLGNQLFQYAIGRAISENNNMELVLDNKTSYKNDKYKRVYSLNNFKIKARLISREEIKRILWKHNFERVSRVIERRLGINTFINYFRINLFSHYLIIKEKSLSFDREILNISKNKDIYLNGYWGSEKYFYDIKSILQEELSVKYNPNEQNQIIIDKISNCESISVHIRRGDFANHTTSKNLHGVCSLGYYKKAMLELLRRVKTPHYFIFSDDPVWAKTNLKLDFPTTFITVNKSSTDYEDLRLMSYCEHNIIANSTFSWWGAWLSERGGKKVIAPSTSFQHGKMAWGFDGLLPDDWIKL